MDSLNPYVPAPLPEPSESPWLLAFAAKQGTSIGIDKTPLDLLLQALSSNMPDERVSALTYLRTIPQVDSIHGITDMAQSTTGVLQDAAISASGSCLSAASSSSAVSLDRYSRKIIRSSINKKTAQTGRSFLF